MHPRPGKRPIHDKPEYMSRTLAECQARIDADGVTGERLEAFLVKVFEKEESAISATVRAGIDPATVAQRILIPRRDLYLFAMYNWVRGVFVAALDAETREGLLVFGVGRIFSAYNDSGCQQGTDADLNFVLQADAGPKRLAALKRAVKSLRDGALERLGLNIEVNHDFTVRTDAECAERIATELSARLFYKCNERSMLVIKDQPFVRSRVFGPCADLPDSLFFQLYLGDSGVKPSLSKIFADKMPLSIVADDGQVRKDVRDCLGSNAFREKQRALLQVHPELYPREWHFSIKYTVNRCHDYLSAILHGGWSAKAIGFSGPADPDLRYLGNAHKLMLYLQELIASRMDLFNAASDYSYMSSSRFTRLSEIAGDEFRAAFDQLVLDGDVLLNSHRAQYLRLRAGIKARSRDRTVSGKPASLRVLLAAQGYQYEKISEDANTLVVWIPFTRADLGFYVFNTITERIISIVENKFMPALKALGVRS